MSSLKVQSEWNWQGFGRLSVFRYTPMEKSNMHSVIPVPLESSVLEVREGHVRGSRWCFSPHAPYGVHVASIMEGPKFAIRIVCEGGETLMSWRCQGFNMRIGMACGSICWPVCRTCEEMQGLCIALVRRNT
jgi:hypothetical protein